MHNIKQEDGKMASLRYTLFSSVVKLSNINKEAKSYRYRV